MRAETALALEQAKAAMDAAEEQDRADLEAAEAEIGDVRALTHKSREACETSSLSWCL